MTEAEWLASNDPVAMLEVLRERPDDRKLTLLVCANVRHVWALVTQEDSRNSVLVAERYVDGLASDAELEVAREKGDRALSFPHSTGPVPRAVYAAAWDAAYASDPPSIFIAAQTSRNESGIPPGISPTFLRDIFGNPFRPVAFDPRWRTDTAVSLARVMYETRDFAAMPILADALQDAGCEHADILDHCRGNGVHVRGCWVVDLVLGRE